MRILMALSIAVLVPNLARAACESDEPSAKYTGRTFSVTVCVSRAASECKDGCYLGATVRRAEDANQFDLPVKKVTAADLADPVTLSHKVGTGYVEYQVALWREKIDCDKNERHGCKQYGYALDNAVYFRPDWDFWGPTSPWAKIKPSRVQLLDAGGGAALKKKASAQLAGAYTVTDGGSASNERDKIEVLYRCAWERKAAWEIAKKLRDAKIGVGWEVKHWAGAPEDFVIAVGVP